MVVAAWEKFRREPTNWSAASRSDVDTVARDVTGGRTFVKRKRMTQEERHLQILKAAMKVIAAKGFWGMSLQDIADEIGITEAAIYHYIQSKDDLLRMVLTEGYDTPDADEFNASSATLTDFDGHRVVYYPRYCLNIVLYNLQRPEMVRLYATLNGEALTPEHPAHMFFIGRQQRNWELVRSMNWILPEGYDEERFYHLYTLSMSAMDGLQYHWLADDSLDLLEEWLHFSDELFPAHTWEGMLGPSEYDPQSQRCLHPFTLQSRS
ncbi:TetR family transcriptional regulator [Bifidobacterium lemurum]|uniref:TetR family transcriptional regulator n=1 Tax=Bifidobacterium lemurum TaxID=1603886 RepID=A0A261FS29_9BIFI|nr:TetR/AcrR family transcriptional regulator [Bifidobacterium lemurum]OZG61753.1 TetR family transcriptional regulator [Bifidobacterium lemurum]QOL34910.1 TetR/AcrR family transcriptional regulator [Bifidobacterium lemurum]